jgi:murein L,D-transpeptidase YafK
VKRIVLISVAVAIVGLTTGLQWPEKRLSVGEKADLVVVRKAERRLDLYRGGTLLKSYAVSLGPNPLGPKQ